MLPELLLDLACFAAFLKDARMVLMRSPALVVAAVRGVVEDPLRPLAVVGRLAVPLRVLREDAVYASAHGD